MNKNEIQVSLGNIPVWQGVQDGHGFTTAPFKFGIKRGLIQRIVSAVETEEITGGYSEDTYSFITPPPGTSDWGTHLGDWYFELLSKQVGNLDGKKVLEIGAGTLWLAERVVEKLGAGYIYTCDPAIRTESINPRVEVVRDYFTPKLFGSETIDLVLSINNLEHIPDPFEYLETVQQLLSTSNGTLFLVVPDSLRGMKIGDLGICVHEHLSYFTQETLENTLVACGFDLSWIHTRDDHIFVTAQPASNKPNDAGRYDHSAELLQRFDERYAHNLESARQLISSQSSKNSLAIHGCSVGINTTLALLGINSNPNIRLFDGDSGKVGKYLPAFDQAILASTDDKYKEMDNVIIAALAFYDEISGFVGREHGIPGARIRPIIPPIDSIGDHSPA